MKSTRQGLFALLALGIGCALRIVEVHAQVPSPAPRFIMAPLPDAAKLPIREAQARLYAAQEKFQEAILTCRQCLVAQDNVDSIAQQLNEQAAAAAKDFGCIGSLSQDTLMCQKAAPESVKPAVPPAKK